MRFQHGVEESPTRLPTSATESEASCCSTPRILRSIASMPRCPGERGKDPERRPIVGTEFLFEAMICYYREKYSISRAQSIFEVRPMRVLAPAFRFLCLMMLLAVVALPARAEDVT